MFKIKNIPYFAYIVLYCAGLTTGEQKLELDLFEQLPTELQVNIAARLPETELNKMLLISKAMYNANYFALEEHRRRAFQNYLLYPFLSSFYEELEAQGGAEIQYRGSEERDTLNMLLKDADNKSFFYSLLLKDAHRDYFNSKNWIKFFNLRTKSYFEGRVTQIMPRTEEHELHKEINKVLIIHINLDDLLPHKINYVVDGYARAIYDKIHRKGKKKAEDRVRIIIDDQDALNTTNPHELAIRFKFFKSIISSIIKVGQEKKTSKIALIKALDLTTYYDHSAIWTHPEIFTQIKNISEHIQLQTRYSKNLFSKKMNGEIQNIIFKPHFFVPIDENLMSIDNLELLCENGFALSLIENIGKDLLTREERFQEDQQIVRILSHYISPFTRGSSGFTILDLLFFTAIHINTTEEHQRKIIELLFSIAKEVEIDLNKYIIVNYATTPLQAAFAVLKTYLNQNITQVMLISKIQRIASIALQFAQRGVNLSLKFNRNVMSTFFEQMYFFNSTTQKNIFDTIVDNEIVPEIGKNIYQRITQEGNTLLHVYFKYARSLNNDIVLKILDQLPNNMINAKNNKGESILECFIEFIRKHRKTAVLGTNISINDPLQTNQIEFLVSSLLRKNFDLAQLTSSGQTYVDLLNGLIREDMQDLERRSNVVFLEEVLNIIKPMQGRIEKRRNSLVSQLSFINT